MYQRQSKSKSSGQTLTGILIGLILGAVIIAALLWFLNQQRVPTEPERTPKNTEVEIMIPNQAVLPESKSLPQTMASAEETVSGWIDEPNVEGHEAEDDGSLMVPPLKSPTNNSVPQAGVVEKKPTVKKESEPKKEVEVKKPKPSETITKEQIATPSKPSAAQILEHGSVEKAQKAAKAEQTVKKETSAKVATERRAKVQAGSYGKAEQAEAQRAKLALLGISAHVETAEVNGKTVHRVRTATLSGENAAQVRQKLQQQGIDAITVNGK